jgi:hypothetical protein
MNEKNLQVLKEEINSIKNINGIIEVCHEKVNEYNDGKLIS